MRITQLHVMTVITVQVIVGSCNATTLAGDDQTYNLTGTLDLGQSVVYQLGKRAVLNNYGSIIGNYIYYGFNALEGDQAASRTINNMVDYFDLPSGPNPIQYPELPSGLNYYYPNGTASMSTGAMNHAMVVQITINDDVPADITGSLMRINAVTDIPQGVIVLVAINHAPGTLNLSNSSDDPYELLCSIADDPLGDEDLSSLPIEVTGSFNFKGNMTKWIKSPITIRNGVVRCFGTTSIPRSPIILENGGKLRISPNTADPTEPVRIVSNITIAGTGAGIILDDNMTVIMGNVRSNTVAPTQPEEEPDSGETSEEKYPCDIDINKMTWKYSLNRAPIEGWSGGVYDKQLIFFCTKSGFYGYGAAINYWQDDDFTYTDNMATTYTPGTSEYPTSATMTRVCQAMLATAESCVNWTKETTAITSSYITVGHPLNVAKYNTPVIKISPVSYYLAQITVIRSKQVITNSEIIYSFPSFKTAQAGSIDYDVDRVGNVWISEAISSTSIVSYNGIANESAMQYEGTTYLFDPSKWRPAATPDELGIGTTTDFVNYYQNTSPLAGSYPAVDAPVQPPIEEPTTPPEVPYDANSKYPCEISSEVMTWRYSPNRASINSWVGGVYDKPLNFYCTKRETFQYDTTINYWQDDDFTYSDNVTTAYIPGTSEYPTSATMTRVCQAMLATTNSDVEWTRDTTAITKNYVIVGHPTNIAKYDTSVMKISPPLYQGPLAQITVIRNKQTVAYTDVIAYPPVSIKSNTQDGTIDYDVDRAGNVWISGALRTAFIVAYNGIANDPAMQYEGTAYLFDPSKWRLAETADELGIGTTTNYVNYYQNASPLSGSYPAVDAPVSPPAEPENPSGGIPDDPDKQYPCERSSDIMTWRYSASLASISDWNGGVYNEPLNFVGYTNAGSYTNYWRDLDHYYKDNVTQQYSGGAYPQSAVMTRICQHKLADASAAIEWGSGKSYLIVASTVSNIYTYRWMIKLATHNSSTDTTNAATITVFQYNISENQIQPYKVAIVPLSITLANSVTINYDVTRNGAVWITDAIKENTIKAYNEKSGQYLFDPSLWRYIADNGIGTLGHPNTDTAIPGSYPNQ